MVYGRKQKDSFEGIRNYDFAFIAFVCLQASISDELIADSDFFSPPLKPIHLLYTE